MLDKRLTLGGLQVGGPRTAQNPARFRVANNVYQTRDGYTVPRFHCEELHTYENTGVNGRYLPIKLFEYDDGVVTVTKDMETIERIALFWDNHPFITPTEVIPDCRLGGDLPQDSGTSSSEVNLPMGVQAEEKLGCLFIHYPVHGLFKFDGSQVYRAGVPLPHFSSAQYTAAGATYVRVIQHHIDFKSNVVNSGYVEFRATPAASKISIRHDKGSPNIIADGFAETPKKLTSKLDGSYDEFFFVMTGAAQNNVLREIEVTTGGDHYVKDNCYVIVSASELIVQFNAPYLTQTTYGWALRVLRSTATTVVLSMDDVKFIDASGRWQEGAELSSSYVHFSSNRNGSNYWLSVWTSNSSTGNYVYRGLIQDMYNSSASTSNDVDVASVTVPLAGYDKTAFNLAGNLGDIYDVTSVKDVFRTPSASFSTYSDLALVADDSEVSFSDTSLGGAFEMVNGLSFVTVGEGGDGSVQTVCGNANFFLVSRQRKNYYVSGNLPTANYRVQSINGTSMGAYSNESCLAYEDVIIFLNKQGVWALYPGGKCEEASKHVNGLFENWSETTEFPEDAFFGISNYPAHVNLSNMDSYSDVNRWIRVKVDKSRGLILFLIAGEASATIFGSGVALILNMNNGEFYTWNGFQNGLGKSLPFVSDIVFKDGAYYMGMGHVPGTGGVFKELKSGVNKYGYRSEDYPIRLDQTWFTAGEPSVEKKLNQVKLWGINTSQVSITHYLDWSSTPVIDEAYANANPELFSHKKRLVPGNFLAVSVSMDINPGASGRFELEGLEIEFQQLQLGVKR